jgi:hypothetical protein
MDGQCGWCVVCDARVRDGGEENQEAVDNQFCHFKQNYSCTRPLLKVAHIPVRS